MTDTANLRIYHLLESATTQELTDVLVSKNGYHPLQLHPLIAQKQGVGLFAFVKEIKDFPPWYALIKPYIEGKDIIHGSRRYDFVLLVELSIGEQTSLFAYTGGFSHTTIAEFIDSDFGLSVLEGTFDPQKNKIDAVSEKGIVGDILASRRFYRRARSVAYEDDFGKYFQTIDVRLYSSQIKEHFPALARYKKKNLRSTISVSGSSSLTLRTKIDLITLIETMRDVALLISRTSPAIFNRSLLPLDPKREREFIDQLEDGLSNRLVDHCSNPDDFTFDADFCPRDFEAYFESSTLEIDCANLTDRDGEKLPPYSTAVAVGQEAGWLIRQFYEHIRRSREYRNSTSKKVFLKDILQKTFVTSLDDEHHPRTSGKLLEYLQLEMRTNSQSFFRMDSKWYMLQPAFDEILLDRFTARIAPQIKDYSFIHPWVEKDELAYNESYDSHTNPFYLHLIKVDYIELCDVLYVDRKKRITYIMHVKDGIGASIRDLTSQVYIAARIIEEEARTKKKNKLSRLYEQGVANKRIDRNKVSKTVFINYFFENNREYCMIVRTGISHEKLNRGDFESRIAKFSLLELSGVMHGNEWTYSIINV